VNAGAALQIYGVVDELGDGFERVRTAIADGTVGGFVDGIAKRSQELAEQAARAAAEANGAPAAGATA